MAVEVVSDFDLTNEVIKAFSQHQIDFSVIKQYIFQFSKNILIPRDRCQYSIIINAITNGYKFFIKINKNRRIRTPSFAFDLPKHSNIASKIILAPIKNLYTDPIFETETNLHGLNREYQRIQNIILLQ